MKTITFLQTLEDSRFTIAIESRDELIFHTITRAKLNYINLSVIEIVETGIYDRQVILGHRYPAHIHLNPIV